MEKAHCALPKPYNYDRFDAVEFGDLKFPGPKPGEQMIDFSVRDLQGRAVKLSDFAGRTIVLETGSCTCPAYAGRIAEMDALTKQYPDALFIVLYVREAHPGERRPGHRTNGEKLQRAASLRDLHQEQRLLLVDDVEGHAHKIFGGLPNLVYVIDPANKVIFRSDWNHPAKVAEAMQALPTQIPILRDHYEIAPMSPLVALRALYAGGWLAMLDLVRQFPSMLHMHWIADRRWRKDQKLARISSDVR